MSFLEKARNGTKVLGTIKKWLENLKTDFINSSGGYDKKDSTLLANRFSAKSSSQFFSDKKIKEIRDSLSRLQSILTDVSDSSKVKELQNLYATHELLDNDVYWQSLKNKTAADGLAQLTFIQNQIELDEVSFLNYIYSNVGWVGLIFDQYKVAIAPYKAALFEGEKFKADVYIAKYSSNPASTVTTIINNREIPMKEGVAHFEKLETSVGKKTLKAIVQIKNPLTGATTESTGIYEYEVLLKCAKNCQ